MPECLHHTMQWPSELRFLGGLQSDFDCIKSSPRQVSLLNDAVELVRTDVQLRECQYHTTLTRLQK